MTELQDSQITEFIEKHRKNWKHTVRTQKKSKTITRRKKKFRMAPDMTH
jgi:hypothetical protein